MKKILMWLAPLLVLAACTTEKKDGITLKFEVEDMTVSQVAVLLDRTTNYSVELDKNGKGELFIEGKEDIYPNIAYGQEMLPVFLKKGEEAVLRFNGAAFNKGIQVEGMCPEASAYLQTMMLPEIQNYALEFPEFKAEVEAGLQQSLDYMKSRGLYESCPDFVEVETSRLRYLFAQSYIIYPMGYAMMHELEAYSPADEYYQILNDLVVERPELADVDAYRTFIQFAVPALLEKEGRKLDSPYNRTVETMKYLVAEFQNVGLRENLLRMLAIDQIQNSGVAGTEEMLKLIKAYVFNPQYLDDIEQVYEEYNPVAIGKKSPDFQAVSLEGEQVSLDDFKGKYLYIDLWATWCQPCRNELPHLKALEEKFAGRNIAFLGLNVDQRKEEWSDFLQQNQKNMSSVQLWLGAHAAFLEDYQVSGIPRFILLDPAGRILQANMLNPSSKEVADMLEGLENL